MTASVVNLNRARKAKERARAERQAAENRVVFGLSKAQKAKTGNEHRRATRDLNGKLIE